MMQNPRQHRAPAWFLHRQRDEKDRNYSQVLAGGLDNKLRENLEQLEKTGSHGGPCHLGGLHVGGQHTKTAGLGV